MKDNMGISITGSKKKTKRILVVSDFTVEHFLDDELKGKFGENGIFLETFYIQYNVFNEEGLEKVKEYDLVILWLNLSDYSGNISYRIEREDAIFNELIVFYNKFKVGCNIPVIWIGFDSYEEDLSILYGNVVSGSNIKYNLNYRLAHALQDRDAMINLEKIISKVGETKAYNLKYKYSWSCIYNKNVFCQIASEIAKQYKIMNHNTPKCVILDCDNVLWGGVLSEEGIEKIKLGNIGVGKIYQDFQRLILQLYNHGVILSIVSKNDIEDVKSVFDTHSAMILKLNHFACIKVNWENKADNILQIANELNISLNSIVFIDDSIFEINLVNEMLPEVKTILFNKMTIFGELNCFNLMREVDTCSVSLRNETYKTDKQRERLLSISKSYEEYLNSLEMKIEVRMANDSDYYRASELSLRTNKRTNGSRYTVEKLKERLKDPLYRLYITNVTDKFCDLGIIGVVGVYGREEAAELDLCCLSCRALGRNIEHVMLNKIDKKYKIKKIKTLSTKKNEDFLLFLKDRYKK